MRECVIVVVVNVSDYLQPRIISVSRIVAVALTEFLSIRVQLIYTVSYVYIKTLNKQLFQAVIHCTVGCRKNHL